MSVTAVLDCSGPIVMKHYPQPRADGCVTNMPAHSSHATREHHRHHQSATQITSYPTDTISSPSEARQKDAQSHTDTGDPPSATYPGIPWGSNNHLSHYGRRLGAEHRFQRVEALELNGAQGGRFPRKIDDPYHLPTFLIWDNKEWPP